MEEFTNDNLVVYTSEHLRTTRKTAQVAKDLADALNKLGIKHRELKHTNDYWVRDFMPVHIFGKNYAIYEYKPDYLASDPEYITLQEDACQDLDISLLSDMGIVFDGGNYVRCGKKVIMTDKILTENPGIPLDVLFLRLKYALGADVVLLPWDMADPCGHADGMVAYLGDNRVLLNNYCQTDKDFAHRLRRILEPHFDIVELSYDAPLDDDCWCYLNYLRVPGAILLPCLSKDFSLPNDKAANAQFEQLFPHDRIMPIYAKPLIKDGGALHCVTWEYFRVIEG